MYKILKNIIEMDDYSVQKLSNRKPPEPFEWNSVEGTELNVDDCIGKSGKIAVKGNIEQASRILPEGYTQVDYIESHGEEYIDTGVNADSNLRTVLDMAYIEPSAANQNVGAINLDNGQVRYHILPQSGFFRIYIQSTSHAINTIATDTDRHLYDIDVPNQTVTVDNNNYSLNTSAFNVELNFYLFARSSTSTVFYSKTKLYRAKMYSSGVIVRDFIPCYRNSDNEIGLYDLVNNVFYTNQGTGAFTYGSVVDIPNPEYPQETKVVTGVNAVKHVGKNLLDLPNKSGSLITLRKLPKKIKAGTYTFSCDDTGKSISIRLSETNETGTKSKAFRTNVVSDGRRYLTESIDFDAEYINISSSETPIEKMQLEEGQLTPYEPYKVKLYQLNLENVELCKIGDYEDILFKNVVGDENYNANLDESAWYKKNVIKKRILNGFETFKSTEINNIYYCAGISDYARTNNKPVCSHFDGFSNIESGSQVVGMNRIGFNNIYNYNRLYISFDGTLEELTDLLAAKNPVLYYATDTPTYEQITDTTLISQLEALNKAKWFKGVNHWWTETNNLEPVLKGTYRQAINE